MMSELCHFILAVTKNIKRDWEKGRKKTEACQNGDEEVRPGTSKKYSLDSSLVMSCCLT